MSSFSVAGSSDTSKENSFTIHSMNGVYRAVEDHTPKQEGEMSLIKGDLITEVRPLGHSWAIGRNYRGFIGTFPTSTVVLVDDSSTVLPLRLTTDPLISGDGPLNRNQNNSSRKLLSNSSERVSASHDTSTNLNASVERLPPPPQHEHIIKPPEKIYKCPKAIENQFNPIRDTKLPPDKTSAINKFFTKPSMLVKPSKWNTSSKTMGYFGSSGRSKSPYMSDKQKTKHNMTFPASNKIIRKFYSKKPPEPDPYYSTPASSCNFSCHCGRSDDGNERILETDKVSIPCVGYYENISGGQQFSTKTGLSGEINSVTPPVPNRTFVYSKVNKPTASEHRESHILHRNNRTPATTDSIVYTEPMRHTILNAPPPDRPFLPDNLSSDNASKGEISILRVTCSFLGALLIGGIIFALMLFILDYSAIHASIVVCVVALVVLILFLVSRLIRCMFAISIPSLSTSEGHNFILIIIWITITWGPLHDLSSNLMVTLETISCLSEQSFNQTNLLIQPYDSMMEQVNRTIFQLELAAREVNFGLLPLDQGLEHIEMELQNGRAELLSTKKTCQAQLMRAYNECSHGLAQAQVQCKQVMNAIGTVYHHARQALDRINPDRWGLNIPTNNHRFKRRSQSEMNIPMNGPDICEPLNEKSVCRNLNDTSEVCNPAFWAGNEIQKAINSTQNAMKKLHRTLQFHITSTPYWSARQSAQEASTRMRKNVAAGYLATVKYFDMAIKFLLKCSPLCSILLLISAYKYIKKYVTDVKYDNCHVNKKLDVIDHLRSSSGRGIRLLPFRKHEHMYIERGPLYSMDKTEDNCVGVGLLTATIHLCLGLMVYMISYKFYLVLSLVKTEGGKARDMDGRESLDMVVTGEGMIVELLDIFFTGLHPSSLHMGNTTNVTACLPPPRSISLATTIVVAAMFFVLFLCVVLKQYFFTWRNKITGYFYMEHRQLRLAWLYDHMQHRRSKYPGILLSEVLFNYRVVTLERKISNFHSCLGKNYLCRQRRKCFLCGSNESYLSRRCVTERCAGIYCLTCLNDMDETCPLCWLKHNHERRVNT